MAGRNDRYCCRTRYVRPSGNGVVSRSKRGKDTCGDIPFSFVIDYELEHAVSIRHSELDAVLPWGARDRWQCGTDMWVQHCEVQLEIFEVRVRLPGASDWVKFGDVSSEDSLRVGRIVLRRGRRRRVDNVVRRLFDS